MALIYLTTTASDLAVQVGGIAYKVLNSTQSGGSVSCLCPHQSTSYLYCYSLTSFPNNSAWDSGTLAPVSIYVASGGTADVTISYGIYRVSRDGTVLETGPVSTGKLSNGIQPLVWLTGTSEPWAPGHWSDRLRFDIIFANGSKTTDYTLVLTVNTTYGTIFTKTDNIAYSQVINTQV